MVNPILLKVLTYLPFLEKIAETKIKRPIPQRTRIWRNGISASGIGRLNAVEINAKNIRTTGKPIYFAPSFSNLGGGMFPVFPKMTIPVDFLVTFFFLLPIVPP